MAVKELKTRIQLKHDSYSAWTTAPGKDTVLLAGEIGICEIPSEFTANGDSQVMPTVLFKVGNGTSTFENLPWASAKAADVYGWAKASDVVLEGKTIKFVGTNKTITLNYVTETEVKAITDPIAARVSALEGKFGTEGDVAVQLADHESRLDVIEGEAEGSVKKALVDAKAYTDEREVEIKAYADQAEADALAAAKLYTDGKVTDQGVKDAAQDALISANASAIEKEASDRATAITSAVNGVTSAYEAADLAINNKIGTVADGKTVVGLIGEAQAAAEGKVTELANGQVAANKAAHEKNASDISGLQADLSDEVEAREALAERVADLEEVDNATQAELDAYKTVVTNAIGTAKQEAITAAEADAAAKVKALKEGDVATNASNISKNTADIEQLGKDLAAEAKTRGEKDVELEGRLEDVEAFFHTAEGETLDGALDTLKEIQDYLKGEEGAATGGLLSRVGDAEAAIEDLEAEFAAGGRVTQAEADIDALESDVDDIEAILAGYEGITVKAAVDKAQADATQALADALAASNKVDTKAAEIKTAYEAYADGKASAAQSAAEATAAGALTAAVGTLNAKDAELVAEDKRLAGLIAGNAKAIEDEVKARGEAVSGEASARAQAIQGINTAIDGINTTVSGVSTVANDAQSRVAAVEPKVEQAEKDIDALEAIVKTGADSNSALRGDITSLQELTGGDNGNVALRGAITDLAAIINNETTGLVATKAIADEAKADAENAQGRVAAIEADYLKAADEYIFNCGTSTTITHNK